MQEIILKIVAKYGYFGVFILIFLENVFPPIPSEVILLFGGFLSGYTNLNLFLMSIFATFGSLFGAISLYYIGRFISVDKMKRIVKGRCGKVLRLKQEDIDKANSWFEKKSNKAVFVCRFVPIVRSLISIPAGMSKMNLMKFMIYTSIGSYIWNIVLIFLGNKVGSNWEIIAKILEDYSFIISVLLVAVGLILIGYFYFKKHFKTIKVERK